MVPLVLRFYTVNQQRIREAVQQIVEVEPTVASWAIGYCTKNGLIISAFPERAPGYDAVLLFENADDLSDFFESSKWRPVYRSLCG